MRRSRYYSSSYSFGSYRAKRRWRTVVLVILMVLLALPIAAELAARRFASTLGLTTGAASASVAKAEAYHLRLWQAGEPRPTANMVGQLLVRSSPALGYDLVPQQSPYWRIGAEGFRDDDPVPLTKPEGEIRIFLLGNSTAFGVMADSNADTLAAKIEQRLNAHAKAQDATPEKFKPLELPYFASEVEAMAALPPRIRPATYRAIAAAVPGYQSGNELSLFAHRLLAYKPDAVVILDGYEDLRSPSDRLANRAEDVGALASQTTPQPLSVAERLQQQWKSLYVVKLWGHWFGKEVASSRPIARGFAANQFPNDPAELQKRVDRYRTHLSAIAKLAAGIPTIVALQPELTGKPSGKLSAEETQIASDLGQDYRDRVARAYAALDPATLQRALPSLRIVSYYTLFQNDSTHDFYDPIHLTPAGTERLADRLYGQVRDLFALSPEPTYRRR